MAHPSLEEINDYLSGTATPQVTTALDAWYQTRLKGQPLTETVNDEVLEEAGKRMWEAIAASLKLAPHPASKACCQSSLP